MLFKERFLTIEKNKLVNYYTDYHCWISRLLFYKRRRKKVPQAVNYKTVKAEKADLRVYVSAEGHVVKIANKWPDYKDFAVQIMVDELEINQIKEKQTAEVHIEAVEDTVYKGKVAEINDKGVINGSVTSYAVTIDLDNEASLKENMSVSADVLVALEKNALITPIEAVHTDKTDKTYAYIIGEDKQKRKYGLKQVNITLSPSKY